MSIADLRPGLLDLAAEHQLPAAGLRQLQALAGLDAEPAALVQRLRPAFALLAAALLGFGVVMWVAANWADWPRPLRFGLLQALVALSLLGAWQLPRARVALGLLAFLGQGALFAFFGQTYQTGADPWQLFAVWAVLGLPLALALRHDALWLPWVLVVGVGIGLWVHAHSGHRWRVDEQTVFAQSMGALVWVLLGVAVSPLLAAWTGAGRWPLRAVALIGSGTLAAWALAALFQGGTVHAPYFIGTGLLACATLALWRLGDVIALSPLALAMNALLVCGLGRLWFAALKGDTWVLGFLVLGLSAAGLLSLTVKLLTRRAKEVS